MLRTPQDNDRNCDFPHSIFSHSDQVAFVFLLQKAAPTGPSKSTAKGAAPAGATSKQSDTKKTDAVKKDGAAAKDAKGSQKGPAGKDAKKADNAKNAAKGPNAAKKAKKGCCNIV